MENILTELNLPNFLFSAQNAYFVCFLARILTARQQDEGASGSLATFLPGQVRALLIGQLSIYI